MTIWSRFRNHLKFRFPVVYRNRNIAYMNAHESLGRRNRVWSDRCTNIGFNKLKRIRSTTCSWLFPFNCLFCNILVFRTFSTNFFSSFIHRKQNALGGKCHDLPCSACVHIYSSGNMEVQLCTTFQKYQLVLIHIKRGNSVRGNAWSKAQEAVKLLWLTAKRRGHT